MGELKLWNRARLNSERGVGWLAHPAFLVVVVVVLGYLALSLATGTFQPRLGTIFVLAALAVVVFWRNAYGVLLGIILAAVGFVLLYYETIHVIGF